MQKVKNPQKNMSCELSPYPKISLPKSQARSIINIQDRKIGDGYFLSIAGSCAVESEEQIFQTASAIQKSGAQVLRGGAFKPRSSPYDFQGLGEKGLQYLHAAAKNYDLICVSEVMDTSDIQLVAQYVDILQVGSRNMHNFSLLKALGKINKPILLKRGFAATYHEFLLAAEYIAHNGNDQIILCERGIRTFEQETRNCLDLAAVPVIQEKSRLPIIVDPSHGTGKRSLIAPMTKAAIACGADGVMIEVHPTPDAARTDSMQTISTESFHQLMKEINASN